VERLIDKLADKHKDWIRMAKSFGCSDDDANELVQQMYVRLTKYVDDPKRIMYDKESLNTYYVYITLRNLYLTNFHKNKIYYPLSDRITAPYDPSNIEKEEAYEKVITAIETEVFNWYWYDRKLWDIHFKEQRSMRNISSLTKISLSSIFNTLKNCKNKIRDKFYEDVEDLKNGDYDRI